MTTAIIITFCILLLVAYVFDLTSSKTKIPSVILLLVLGWFSRYLSQVLGILLPDFSVFLPVLGTVGLILIVLEGSLELELNASKIKLIKITLWGALVPIVVLSIFFAAYLTYFGGYDWKTSLANVVPLCVISSAIAIPSVQNLSGSKREFVIYESSFSDIIGVVLFNFLAYNSVINGRAFLMFGAQLLIIIAVSLVATFGLSFMLGKIEHRIKFIPIILIIILIYAVSKEYHLPSLVFILIFGLIMGNLNELKRFGWLAAWETGSLQTEVHRFHEVTTEAAFLVRTLFFLLFGYLINEQDVFNLHTLPLSLSVVGIILLVRIIQLKTSGIHLAPLAFVAPRGLITILLFLSIPAGQSIPLVDGALIIQIILIMALIMMGGLMIAKQGS
jgi:Kef-type K+ transport system membrane component KefB